jgi:hypothetical protein
MYNSKYLKYKNKYLSLKKILGGMYQEPDNKVNVIVCLFNGEERSITILKKEKLVPAIARELGVRPTQIIVFFIDNFVNIGLTAEDCRIVNNSRLTITYIDDIIKTKEQFNKHVLPNMMELNSHLISDEIMNRITTINLIIFKRLLEILTLIIDVILDKIKK